MTAIRVLIADDEALVRSGLRAILGAEPDIEVVGEAADGAEALSLCRTQRPDVMLMDVRMPGLDGITATRRILDAVFPPPRIVVVTTFENDDYVYEALRVARPDSCSSGLVPSTWSRPCARWRPATRCCSPPRCATWRPANGADRPRRDRSPR